MGLDLGRVVVAGFREGGWTLTSTQAALLEFLSLLDSLFGVASPFRERGVKRDSDARVVSQGKSGILSCEALFLQLDLIKTLRAS